MKKLFPCFFLWLFTLFSLQHALAADGPAVIRSVNASGVGYVTYSTDNVGINAKIGRFDTPYTGGTNGPPIPGLEPDGASVLSIIVDVNSGGKITFAYSLSTYDAGIYDWYDISLITSGGTVPLVTRLGKPGADYGDFFKSSAISLSVDLTRYKNQTVTFQFSVQQDGYGDQTQGELMGFNLSTCAVTPLSAITDAQALRFEGGDSVDTSRLVPAMQTALGCVDRAVTAAGGRINVASAFRPVPYQVHLREVWDKWDLLMDNRDPGCAELKRAVALEFLKHGLNEQRPAVDSRHTRGEALDMGSTLPVSRLVSIASTCQLYRNVPVKDPVHFIHQ